VECKRGVRAAGICTCSLMLSVVCLSCLLCDVPAVPAVQTTTQALAFSANTPNSTILAFSVGE
jgi:hypothetical protein